MDAVSTPFSLDAAQVRHYWQELSPELASIFDAIESHENWVADKQSEDIAARVVRFGRRLGEYGDPAVLLEANRSDLLIIFCYLSTSKSLRLLDYLQGFDGLGSQVIQYLFTVHSDELKEAGASQKLIELLGIRLKTVMQVPYLRGLFNPQRVEEFLIAIRSHTEEVG